MTSLSFVKVKTKPPLFHTGVGWSKHRSYLTLRLPRTRTVTNGKSVKETSAPYGKILRILLDAYSDLSEIRAFDNKNDWPKQRLVRTLKVDNNLSDSFKIFFLTCENLRTQYQIGYRVGVLEITYFDTSGFNFVNLGYM